MKSRYTSSKWMLDSFTLIFDFVGVTGALLIARFIRARTDLIPGVQLPIGEIPELFSFILFSFVAGVVFVLIGAWQKFYFKRNDEPFWVETGDVIVHLLIWLAVLSTYFYFTRELFFSRLALGYAVIMALMFILIVRVLIRYYKSYLKQKGLMQRRAWVIGSEREIENLKKMFGKDKLFVFVSEFRLGDLIASDQNDFSERFERELPDVLIIGNSLRDEKEHFLVRCCQVYGMDYIFLPESHTNYIPGGVVMGFAGKSPYLVASPTRISGLGAFFKRAFDIVFALFAVIVLSPLLISMSIISFFSIGLPIIYRFQRVGKHGNKFTFCKFRSMVKNADEMKAKLEAQNERDGKLFKMKNDPRITPWGRFIRKWSIDELAQLWNILKGDMSFVGPRPHEPKEVSKYTLEERRLLSVRPGLTSFYAIHDRALSFEREVELEIYYLENWSIILDFYIIWKTFWVALKGSGA